MNLTITAYLTNGTSVASQVIDTEQEAREVEATHDEFLIRMAEVIDAYENVSQLSKFTLVDETGDTVSINPNHVLFVRISGWDAKAAVAAIEARDAERNARRTQRRGY